MDLRALGVKNPPHLEADVASLGAKDCLVDRESLEMNCLTAQPIRFPWIQLTERQRCRPASFRDLHQRSAKWWYILEPTKSSIQNTDISEAKLTGSLTYGAI